VVPRSLPDRLGPLGRRPRSQTGGARFEQVRDERPGTPGPWLAALTVVIALLAWGDNRHRVLLVIMAAVLFVAAVVVGIRQIRERAYWRRVGRSG
jgi:hypothetical protein